MRGRLIIGLMAVAAACSGFHLLDLLFRTRAPVVREVDTTGYCNCERCCGWVRSWHGFGHPVYASGRLKGRRKAVGVTASGERTRRGTVAADTAVFPFGTVVFIPEFGWGRVEDRGGAIRGNRMDLWFEDHAKALQWGRRKVAAKVWLPADRPRNAVD